MNFFEPDKIKHIVAGIVIVICIVALIRVPVFTAFIYCLLLAIGKECYDYWDYGKFSVADILFTLAGGALAWVIIFLYKNLL